MIFPPFSTRHGPQGPEENLPFLTFSPQVRRPCIPRIPRPVPSPVRPTTTFSFDAEHHRTAPSLLGRVWRACRCFFYAPGVVTPGPFPVISIFSSSSFFLPAFQPRASPPPCSRASRATARASFFPRSQDLCANPHRCPFLAANVRPGAVLLFECVRNHGALKRAPRIFCSLRTGGPFSPPPNGAVIGFPFFHHLTPE